MSDAIREEASLHALGLLEGEEKRLFEMLLGAANQEAIEALGEAFEAAAAVGLTPPPESPPAGLKARLFQRIRSEQSPALGAIRAGEGRWTETGIPGVTYRALYHDRLAGLVTNLVRMAPGSRWPAHVHVRDEQCYILEGDLRHDGHVYQAGDFTWAKANSLDPELHTLGGNLLLIIGSPDTKVSL